MRTYFYILLMAASVALHSCTFTPGGSTELVYPYDEDDYDSADDEEEDSDDDCCEACHYDDGGYYGDDNYDDWARKYQ